MSEDEKKKSVSIIIGKTKDKDKETPVYLTAWEKKSKTGKTYYVAELPIFVNE